MKNNLYKIKKIVPLLLVLTIVFYLEGRASANPILMGRIMTVHPYGAQDAARNPALMQWERQKSTVGFAAGYHTNASSSINNNNVLFLVSKLDLTVFDSGNASLSYINKSGIWAIGFDLYANYEHSNLDVRNFFQNIPITILGNGRLNAKIMATALTLSGSMAVHPQHSLGIQVRLSYGSSENTEAFKSGITFFGISRVSSDSRKSTYEQVSAAPAVGYFYKFGNSEAGLMLTAGRLTWNKTTNERTAYELSPGVADLNFKGKKSLPFEFSYSAGPGIIAGAFTKLTGTVNFGLECEVTMPLTYKNNFLYIPDGSTFFYVKNTAVRFENKKTDRPSVTVRGGFELIASSNATLSLGGGLAHTETESRIHGKLLEEQILQTDKTYKKILSLYGMAGIDFLFGKSNVITIGLMLSHNTSTQKETFKNIDITLNKELTRTSTKIKAITLNTIMAMSFGF